jgi:hypothetical protein
LGHKIGHYEKEEPLSNSNVDVKLENFRENSWNPIRFQCHFMKRIKNKQIEMTIFLYLDRIDPESLKYNFSKNAWMTKQNPKPYTSIESPSNSASLDVQTLRNKEFFLFQNLLSQFASAVPNSHFSSISW